MKKTRKILTLLLSLAMMASLLAAPTLTPTAAADVAASGNWSDYADASGLTDNGDGSYAITSEAGLAYLAAQVRGGDDFGSKIVNLTADLNLGAHNWTPIGYTTGSYDIAESGPPSRATDRPFGGLFDGNGHSITGLTINDGPSAGEERSLFGFVDVSGIVQNLAVLEAYINCMRRGAGIAATNFGTIRDCMSTGSFIGNGTTRITRITAGIVGVNHGLVENCYSNALVSDNNVAGGIVGGNAATGRVVNCFFTGYAVARATVNSTVNPGTTEYASGSLVGNNLTGGTVTNCYYLSGSSSSGLGFPASFANGATAKAFNNYGELVDGSDDLINVLSSGYKLIAGTYFPVLAWETTYNHADVAPPSTQDGIIIKSAQALFADIPVTMAQLQAFETVRTDGYWMNKTSHSPTYYDSVTGITLFDLLRCFVPNWSRVSKVNFGGAFDFYPQDPEYDSAMLLWSGSGYRTDTGETRIIGSLTSALQDGGGMHWYSGVTTVKVTLTDTSGNWSDNADASGFADEGGGSYTITTAAGLAHFAGLVNGGDDFNGKTVTLAADLNLSAHYWSPISQGRVTGGNLTYPANPFRGVFDGSGHYIIGMTIGGSAYNSGTGEFNEANALFGINRGTVKNVGILAANVDGYRSSACIAGINYGTVENCMSTGDVKANGGGGTRGSGGIVGSNLGTVRYCYSSAYIYNAFRRAGGIVGYNVNDGTNVGTVEYCFFIGYAESASVGYSGSIAAQNGETSSGTDRGGIIRDSYYLESSAKDEQDNGCPKAYNNRGAQAIEFDASGNLKPPGSGTLVATLASIEAFVAYGSDPIPVLSWESSHYRIDAITPPERPQPPEPTAITIISADGYFSNIELTASQIKAHGTTVNNYVRDSNRIYATVTGIALSKLLSEFVPYGDYASQVVFYDSYNPASPATNRTFYPNGGAPAGDTNDYGTAMLLWEGVKDAAWSGSESINGFTSALNNASAGRYWWTNISTITVALPLSDVTFDITPPNAAVEVKDSKNNVIAPITADGKIFKLVQGETYSFGATASGYIGATGTFTPGSEAQTENVVLTFGGGGGTVSYSITGYAGDHGTVTPNVASAYPGVTVTLTAAPASGYALSALSVSGATLNQAVSCNNNVYAFTMPAGNAAVTATFEPVVLTLNAQKGEKGEKTRAAVFTASELVSMSQSGTYAYLFYRNDDWDAVVATELVRFDSLLGEGDLNTSTYWKSGSYLEFKTGDFATYFYYPSYDEITAGKHYYDESGIQSDVPAGIALKWQSGSVGTTGRDAAVTALASAATDTGNRRFVFGLSPSAYSAPAGNDASMGRRFPSQVVEMTVVYEASSVPEGTGRPGGSTTVKPDDPKPDQPDEDFENPFTDVEESDWFYGAVAFVVNAGLFKGVSDDSFAPDATMTRAMLVTVLHRLAGTPEPVGESKFSDVTDPAAYYYDAVIWASANGIVEGYSATTFGADDPITREQMVTFLYRYAKAMDCDVPTSDAASPTLAAFADASSVSTWAQEAMSWAVAAGIVKGTTETTLSPAGKATRAQVATVMQRFAQTTK